MSVTGKAGVLIPVLALVLLAAVIGCGPDRSGTAVANQPPRVFVVNTPPDGAQFSRNPDLSWYGTDLDGYVALFRYGVVLDSMLLINGQHVTVEEFVDQATDQQFNWIELEVDLDNPQTTAEVKLYANIDFPVDSFVTQWFFIQAQDNRGAKSEIVWRRYSRNNHYPNTHFRTADVFINAKDENSLAPGISLTWDGADSADWGRAIPPLEFEWRLYGPYDKDATIYVYEVPENCVWNPDSQKFVNCIPRLVVDLDALPDPISGVAQPILHSKGDNYANDPTDVWVTDEQATLYDVFKDIPEITETTQFKFVFWVRARDDGFVPDPTPSFSQFYVLEALFERDVAVHDETNYRPSAGRWYPEAPINDHPKGHVELCKSFFYGYVNDALQEIRGADYIPFDTFNISVPGLYPEDTKTDYFSSFRQDGPAGSQRILPTMVDLLSHKIHIYFKDKAEGALQEDPAFGLLGQVYFGMNMGASGWLLSRNLAGSDFLSPPRIWPLSAQFADLFGFQSCENEGWLYWSLGKFLDPSVRKATWNEEFVGAVALPELEGFIPDIDVIPQRFMDYYAPLHDSAFLPVFAPGDTNPHVFAAMPEVGTGSRTGNASPVYLYKSIYGDQSIYDGKVCGVVQDMGDNRSAAFLFTPIATDPAQTNEMFVAVLDWLMAPFIQTSTLKSPAGQLSQSGSHMTIEKRREYIQQFLDQIHAAAIEDPEVLTNLGIDLAPVVLHEKAGSE